MKNLIYSFLIFSTMSFAQKQKQFVFKGKNLDYSFVSTAKFSVGKFYVILLENQNIYSQDFFNNSKVCETSNSDYYYLNISEKNFSIEEKQKLIIEFVREITEQRKLIDSRFYLILNKDYSDLYSQSFKKEKLNVIYKLIVKEKINSVCQILE